jgi:hypothetical protein
MANFSRTRIPPAGVGLASIILASVGLFLFILPVLSIPLGITGLIFGLAGLLMSLIGGWASLRWSVAGIALSILTLAISVAIAQTAAGYLSTPPPSPVWQQVPDRPYVPPPSHPGRYTIDKLSQPEAPTRKTN